MTDHQVYLLVAVGAWVVVVAVMALVTPRWIARKARGVLDPEVDLTARREARDAIDRAGGAEALIAEALRHADEQIEAGRRAGAPGTYYVVEARRAYARTGDDEVDALVALSLQRACEASTADGSRRDQEFNDWLRDNGSKFS